MSKKRKREVYFGAYHMPPTGTHTPPPPPPQGVANIPLKPTSHPKRMESPNQIYLEDDMRNQNIHSTSIGEL